MTDLKKLLFQKSNSSEEIATRKKYLLCRAKYSEGPTILKKRSAYCEEVGSPKM